MAETLPSAGTCDPRSRNEQTPDGMAACGGRHHCPVRDLLAMLSDGLVASTNVGRGL